MSENWYAVEQHVRDRIAYARAVSRSQGLARESEGRQHYPDWIALIQRASSVLVNAVTRIIGRSRIFTNLRSATKRC